MVKLKFDIDSINLEMPARDQPRYSILDASGYLNVPQTTISSWFFGTTYGRGGVTTDFAPVLEPASRDPKLLSFNNLAEAYVLRMFRTKDKMNLRSISEAMANARNKFGIEKPLLHEDLLKGGQKLFLRKAGEIIGLSDPKQLLLPNWEHYLDRVEYRDHAVAAIYPLTRVQVSNSPTIVSISPDYSFGSAVVHRTKVKTSVIADRYLSGDSLQFLVRDLSCSEGEIEEAIRAEWMFAYAQSRRAA